MKHKEGGICSHCKHIEAVKRWRSNPINRQKVRDYRNSEGFKEKLRNSLNYQFRIYRTSAKKRGIDFNITKEEFATFWKKDCFYCGETIKIIGIDRKDSNKGYFLGNIVSCCQMCNYMKLDYNYEDFIKKCAIIAKLHDKG